MLVLILQEPKPPLEEPYLALSFHSLPKDQGVKNWHEDDA